jgi:hypothetical protein
MPARPHRVIELLSVLGRGGDVAWTPPLRERVQRGFDEEMIGAFGQRYLEALLTTWRELMQSLRRSTLLLAALITGFVLLKGAKTGEVALGPLRLTNISEVLTIVPALVSLLAYESVSLICAQALYRNMVGEMVRLMYRRLYDCDLEYLLAPTTVMLFGGGARNWEQLRATKEGFAQGILKVTSGLIIGAITGGALGFLYYAYKYLYADSHTAGLTVSISLAVAALFALRTVALMVDTNNQERITGPDE